MKHVCSEAPQLAKTHLMLLGILNDVIKNTKWRDIVLVTAGQMPRPLHVLWQRVGHVPTYTME